MNSLVPVTLCAEDCLKRRCSAKTHSNLQARSSTPGSNSCLPALTHRMYRPTKNSPRIRASMPGSKRVEVFLDENMASDEEDGMDVVERASIKQQADSVHVDGRVRKRAWANRENDDDSDGTTATEGGTFAVVDLEKEVLPGLSRASPAGTLSPSFWLPDCCFMRHNPRFWRHRSQLSTS